FSDLEKQMVSQSDMNRWASRWGAERGGNRGQKHSDENERVPGAKERARMARKYRKRDDGSLDWGHCSSDPAAIRAQLVARGQLVPIEQQGAEELRRTLLRLGTSPAEIAAAVVARQRLIEATAANVTFSGPCLWLDE